MNSLWNKFFAIASVFLATGAQAADIAISALPAASSVTGSDVVPIVQSATTKKASFTVQKGLWDTFYQPLDGDLTALAALTGTNTIYYRSAASTWSAVTINAPLGFSGGILTVTDAQLISLSDLSYTGNSLKFVRVNAGETGFELATVSTTTTGAIGFTTDGGGVAIPTGVKGYFTVPYSGTITGWAITAVGSSPTCTIDVWKIATGTALPTVSNTITASAKPALSTGNAIRSSTLTGWTTSFSAGDIFGFNVDALTVATKLTFTLEVTH